VDDALPTGHARQEVELVPGANKPGAHCKHVCCWLAALYEPGVQAAQNVPALNGWNEPG
jgi:hypothetical protein